MLVGKIAGEAVELNQERFVMSLKPHIRAGLTLTVVMFALLLLGAAFGVNVGPVELFLWLAVLLVGWVLCMVGGARGRSSPTGTKQP